MRASICFLKRSAAALFVSTTLVGPAYGDLIHYQAFDEGSNYSLSNGGAAGGTSTTVNVYGNDSTSTTDTPSPFVGYAQHFAGVYYKNEPYPWQGFGGNVNIANSTSTFNLDSSLPGQPQKAMTLSLWVKWDGDQHGVDQGIVSKFTGDRTSGWGLSIGSTGLLNFAYTGPNQSNRTATQAMTSGTWQHVALSWQVGDSGGFHMYLNGNDVAPYGGYVGDSTGMIANTEAIKIGNSDGTYNPFAGAIDDFAMFDTVLSAGEIRAIDTAPVALGNYTADKMQTLFSLYAGTAAGTATINGTTWSATTGLTGHLAGDSWTDGTESFIQFDTLGNGVAGVVPEPASLAAIGTGAALLLRRRRPPRRV